MSGGTLSETVLWTDMSDRTNGVSEGHVQPDTDDSARCGRNLVWYSKQSNSTDMCIYSIGYLSVIEDIRGSPGLAGSIASLYGEPWVMSILEGRSKSLSLGS